MLRKQVFLLETETEKNMYFFNQVVFDDISRGVINGKAVKAAALPEF